MKKLDSLITPYPRSILAVILLGYLINSSLFALLTPPWQSPDEPAHYNYIAHVARGEGLPILKMGDFNMEYIGQVTSRRFPPDLSVEIMRYEFYQPPLYYLSAVPIYWLAGGLRDVTNPENYGYGLTALRFYGIGLGFISLLLIHACLAVAFPAKPAIRLGASAFAATLPMHVALLASVNNDTLAHLLLLVSSLLLLRWMREALSPELKVESQRPSNNSSLEPGEWRSLLALGILLGLGFLTKIYAYAFLPICLCTIFFVTLQTRGLRSGFAHVAWVLIPALLMGLPLWLRNMFIYGFWDPLALSWHDAVVAGQPTTSRWIAEFGWTAYWDRTFGFTFRSFWGVFGWLGVFWDERFYTGMKVLSITIGLGLGGGLFSQIRTSFARAEGEERSVKEQLSAWILLFLALNVVAVLLSYGLYNLKFVQHQGRYFFWGILPVSTFVALGWRHILRRNQALVAALLLLLIGFAATTLGERNLWTLLSFLVMAGLLLLQYSLQQVLNFVYNQSATDKLTGPVRILPRAVQKNLVNVHTVRLAELASPLVWAFPFLVLFVLGIHSVFGYVVPQLQR